MSDQIHPQKKSERKIFRRLRKSAMFTLALFFGIWAVVYLFSFVKAVFDDTLVNAGPFEQGVIFSRLTASIILYYLARKSWAGVHWGY